LTAFNHAKRAGRFVGPNPATEVARRKVAKRLPDFLHAEEVLRVLTPSASTADPAGLESIPPVLSAPQWRRKQELAPRAPEPREAPRTATAQAA
jgi:hypothetical protein